MRTLSRAALACLGLLLIACSDTDDARLGNWYLHSVELDEHTVFGSSLDDPLLTLSPDSFHVRAAGETQRGTWEAAGDSLFMRYGADEVTRAAVVEWTDSVLRYEARESGVTTLVEYGRVPHSEM